MMTKLRFIAAMSTLWLLFGLQGVAAHEVTPTIADLTVADGELQLDLRLNIEAFVAGVDLDGMTDTDAAAESADYDQLRAMAPAELAPLVTEFARTWNPSVRISLDDTAPLALTLGSLNIPQVGDATLPRATRLVLTAPVAPDARVLTLSWPRGAGDLVLRQQGPKDPFTGYIEGGQTSPDITLAGGNSQTWLQTFTSYVPVGFDHILPKGLDHILFVLGLFFLSTQLRPLLWQVSAFTLAHTVTLALGASGAVTVPSQIVEPLIAASIIYVAVENLVTDGLSRWRPLVIFGFGLLHGLGFASVLGEFGLPEDQFLSALIGFNIGVEIGQLTVIAMAFLAVGVWFRHKPWYRRRIAMPASAAIALTGAVWFFERVL